MKKNIIFCIALHICLTSMIGTSCTKDSFTYNPPPNNMVPTKPIGFLKEELTKPNSKYVMVVAHRGYWHEAPENSILSIEKAIEIGADMVELDVQKTKDGVLVLMHDATVERTTNGKGKVADFTLEEIQQLKLKAHTGQVTERKVPTLEEAMVYAKDKILVNIDKADDHFEEIGRILKKTNTLDIAIVKSGKSVKDIATSLPHITGSPFMAVISLDKNTEPLKKADDYVTTYGTKIMEISYQTENSTFFDGYYNDLKTKGVKLWMTPCDADFCAGHHDARAISGDTDGSWGWLLKHGATLLLSNEPKELILYLQKNGFRN